MRNLGRYIVGALFVLSVQELWTQPYQWWKTLLVLVFGLIIAGDLFYILLTNHIKNNP